jgi:IS30 family transposase
MSYKPYSRFTHEQRKEIERLLKEGLSHTKIAKKIGRSQGSVSREIRKQGTGEYNADEAQKNANSAMKRKYLSIEHINEKIKCIEMQLEIIFEILKEKK